MTQLIWVYDKKFKYTDSFTSLPPTSSLSDPQYLPPFVIYSPIYVYMIISFFLYKHTSNINKYSNAEFISLISGIITGLCILFFFIWIPEMKTQIWWDKTIQQMVYWGGTTQQSTNISSHVLSNNPVLNIAGASPRVHSFIIVENNIFQKTEKEKEEIGYAITRKKLIMLIKKHNIKLIPWYKWAEGLVISTPFNDAGSIGLPGGPSPDWKINVKYSLELGTLLLTLIFILANWNYNIFKRISPWIYCTLLLLMSNQIWFQMTSLPVRQKYFYLTEKVNLVSSCLTIIIIFLFLSGTQHIHSKK